MVNVNYDSNGFTPVGRPDNKTRIVYVDPNDIYDDINGVPLTPDYTDYCIWCNLIVEKSSRIKNGVEGTFNNGSNELFSIAWDATAAEGTQHLSFMRGQDALNYNFLTTDYTNIDFNTIKQRNMIEGLGIESINISMNNYYVPEVTINFIDVRGAGFFGREEATHDTFDLTSLDKDEYGNVIDNFYSCFVSFPYPRFRLQIKGFYGNPVTYQLTCSHFSGDFDSSNGNFKLTAKFIGYQYSILADIPFKYIVAAPICTYEGQAYWDRHESSKSWELWKDTKPVKLIDFYNKINSSINTEEGISQLMTTDKTVSINNLSTAKKDLSIVYNAFKDFELELSKLFNGNDSGYVIRSFYNNRGLINSEVVNEQIIFFSQNETVTLTKEVCDKYNHFVRTLDAYTETYQGEPHNENNECFDKSRRPNIGEDKWEVGDIHLTEFLNTTNGSAYLVNNGKLTTSTSNASKGIPVSRISSGGSNGSIDVCYELSAELQNRLKDTSKIVKNNYKYACILDCKRITPLYNELIGKIESELARTSQELEDEQELNLINYFGFAPYVGNFFKIVMCHLETFIHIMYRVAENIDYQQLHYDRLPEKLGVNLNETDVNGISFVPAWPAIYKPAPTPNPSRYEDIDEAVDSRGWVGDVRGPVEWEEKRMIDALYYALRNIVSPLTIKPLDLSAVARPSVLNTVFPLIPSDLVIRIPKYAYASKHKFIAYLGIRMMQVFGMFNRGNQINGNIAEKLGKLDAYNYFKNKPYGNVDREIFRAEADRDRIEEFLDILSCKENGRDENYSFELVKSINGRHPIFTDDGSKLTYVYMLASHNNKVTPLLPTNVQELPEYIKNYYGWYSSSSGSVFYANYAFDEERTFSNIANNSQYTGNSTNYVYNATSSNSGEEESILMTYQNPSMFYVVDNDKDIETIEKIYRILNGDEKQSGTQFSILTENTQEYTDIARNYWLNIDVDEANFYDNNLKSRESWSINYDAYKTQMGTDVIPESVEMIPMPNVTLYKSNVDWQPPMAQVQTETRMVVVSNSKVDLRQYFLISYCYSDGTLRHNTLFSTSLYYAQNGEEFTGEWRPPQTGVQLPYVDENAKKTKMLLFLHTFMFKFNMMKNKSFFNSNTMQNGGIEKLPYLYILFIGGLIWRKRYVEANGSDPIKFYGTLKKPSNSIDPLLRKDGDKFYFVFSHDTNPYNVKYSDIVNPNMDIVIENMLIHRFEEYVSFTYDIIEQSLEIHCSDFKNQVKRLFTYNDILYLVKELNKSKSDEEVGEIINNMLGKSSSRNFLCGISDFNGKYNDIGIARKTNVSSEYNNYMFCLCKFPETKEEELYDSWRNQKCYVLTSIDCNKTSKTVYSISKQLATSYLNGFLNTLEKFVDTSDRELVVMGAGIDNKAKQERDIKVGMYLYLKNLWDKWLCGYYYSNGHINNDETSPLIKDTFDVENYFTSFLFMDSFYRNIFKRLKLNCEKLYKAFNGGTTDYNIYSYLGKVASDHQCMFLSLPDYVNLGDNDSSVAVENMCNMFRPLPANSVPLPQRDNKFVVMYTHQPSSIATVDKSDYKPDSFDIWSENDGTNIAPAKFHFTKSNNSYTPTPGLTKNQLILESQLNRYGYNVPAFGVAYSKQGNSIFKNIKASMSNPVMTEQAILAMGSIAEMGNSTMKKVCFYGQDIYPIYSNYSYTVEIDMMGNAQIQPLMYFQLMNIPMFRGTYMIIAVTHSMSQGNMTTHVKATKMSKYATPFVTNWFTLPERTEEKPTNGLNSGGDFDYIECDVHKNMVAYLKDSWTVNKYLNGEVKDMNNPDKKVKLTKGCTKKPNQFTGYCAGYVNDAIVNGGGFKNYKKGDAGEGRGIEKHLEEIGFARMTNIQINKAHKDNFENEIAKCKPGDVAIFSPVPNHQYGHTQMCVGIKDGKPLWGSDYDQGTSFWCNIDDFKPKVLNDESYVRIYRYVGSDCKPSEAAYSNNMKSVEITSNQKQANAVWLMKYFTKQLQSDNNLGNNLTLHQAAALIGNLWAESAGCNPEQKQYGGGGGRGLAQWTTSNRKKLWQGSTTEYDLGQNFNFNIENMMTGDISKDLKDQARFCAWELKNRGGFKNIFYGTSNPSISYDNVYNEIGMRVYTQKVMEEYECPQVVENKKSNPEAFEKELEKRLGFAKQVYNLYKQESIA